MNETTPRKQEQHPLVQFGREVHTHIARHLTNNARDGRIFVLAIVGENTWGNPAAFQKEIMKGMRDQAQDEEQQYQWLSTACPSTGDPMAFEHALAIALVRELIEARPSGSMTAKKANELKSMLPVLQARSWSVGLRDAFEHELQEMRENFLPMLLAVWEPDNLKATWTHEMIRAVRWMSAAAGIRAVALRSQRYLDSAELLVKLPQRDGTETAEELSTKFLEDTKGAWTDLIQAYLDTNGFKEPRLAEVFNDRTSNMLAEIIKRAAALHYPKVLDLARFKGRLWTIASSMNKDAPRKGCAADQDNFRIESAQQRVKILPRSEWLGEEIKALCSRICFLLVLEQLCPDLAAKVCDDAEGSFNLYRLQLTFLQDERPEQPARSLLDEEWTRTYVQDKRLTRLFVDLMKRRPADGLSKSGADGAALVRPFESVGALIQCADLVFGGTVRYVSTDIQEKWDKWLDRVGKQCEEEWRKIREYLSKNAHNIRVWRQDALGVDEVANKIRNRLKEIPPCAEPPESAKRGRIGEQNGESGSAGNSGGRPPPTCELAKVFGELKGEIDDLLNRLDATKQLSQVQGGRFTWPENHAASLHKELDELDLRLIRAEANAAQLLDVGPRLLTCAEIAWYLTDLVEEGVEGCRGGAGRKWSEEVTKQLKEWCRNYEAVESFTRGRVHFELCLMHAQMRAALRDFDGADEEIKKLGKEVDRLRQAHLTFVQAWVREMRYSARGQYGMSVDEYRKVDKEARELGARELRSRAVRAGMRGAMLLASKPDPWVRLLWAASAAAVLNAERSPRVSRIARMFAPVFVSYRRSDFGKATQGEGPGGALEALINQLGEKRELLWIDRFAIDDDTQEFSPLLSVALQNAAGVLVLFSINYFSSEWCRWELRVATALARQGSVQVEYAFCGDGGELLKTDEPKVSREAHHKEVNKALEQLGSELKMELGQVVKEFMDEAQMRTAEISIDTLKKFVLQAAETGNQGAGSAAGLRH